jgi:hypothetical protein
VTWPDCAPPIETPVDFPSHFAPNFPYPPGLRLFIARNLNNDPNYIQLVGYAPLSIKNSIDFMLNEVPKAGYTLGRGDSEPGEAEVTFSGYGWRGGFRASAVNQCEGVTEWLVVVVKR